MPMHPCAPARRSSHVPHQSGERDEPAVVAIDEGLGLKEVGHRGSGPPPAERRPAEQCSQRSFISRVEERGDVFGSVRRANEGTQDAGEVASIARAESRASDSSPSGCCS